MLPWLSSLEFGALQFGSASALFAGLAIPLLVLAYLKKQQRKRKVVSSLLLLQNLTRHATVKRRFRPPLRFFLELLALCLLTLAAAAPAFRSRSSHTALLLDTSMSMRAVKGSGGGSPSRLNVAVDSLRNWLTNQTADYTYALYVSSPKLTRIGDEPISRSELPALLEQLEATWSGDSFDSAVLELAESGTYDRVIGFSDRSIAEQAAEAEAEAAGRKDDRTQIQLVQVGAPEENFFISNIQAKDGGGGGTRITATVGFSGGSPIPLTAELRPVSASGEAGGPIRRTRIQAEPGRNVEADFSLPASQPRAAAYMVRLLPRGSGLERNALTEDDNAWISDRSSGSINLLLVTSSGSELGLDRIPAVGFTRFSPQQFARSSSADLNRFALIVFHRSAPAFVPSTPTLLILPPGDNPLFPAAGRAERPNITSWDSGSPITRYLRVPLIQPKEAVLLDIPPWAQPVISVEEGTLVGAGETGGVRLAAAGIELLPFEGRQTPGLSILTLNLINWLTGSSELISGFLTGSTMRLEAGKSWIIRSPSGEITTIDVGGQETAFYSFNQPGLYVLSSIVEGTTRVDQARTQLYTVNAFHPEESATFAPPVLTLPRTVFRESAAAPPEQPLWPWLAALALLMMSLELIHHLLRGSKLQEAV